MYFSVRREIAPNTLEINNGNRATNQVWNRATRSQCDDIAWLCDFRSSDRNLFRVNVVWNGARRFLNDERFSVVHSTPPRPQSGTSFFQEI